MTSTANGRKKVHLENSRNQASKPKSLLKQVSQTPQTPQTPDMQTQKKNESNIRLSYINKPKLSLKQQIEECQLKLSAKKKVILNGIFYLIIFFSIFIYIFIYNI